MKNIHVSLELCPGLNALFLSQSHLIVHQLRPQLVLQVMAVCGIVLLSKTAVARSTGET
jgi:hypothetical protein